MLQPSTKITNLIKEQYEIIDKANSRVVEIWNEEIVFTFAWWISFLLVTVPWIIWFFYRKKESTNRLLIGGIWTMFIATWLNYLGVTLGLWRYNVKTIPVIPDFIAWDFSLMPVTIMFIIQIKPNMKPIIKAILFAAVTSFAAEPFFKWLGFFEYPAWHFWASFPFYIVIYLIASALVNGKNFYPIKSTGL